MTISATMASGIVRDMPKVATNGVVHTTHNALHKDHPSSNEQIYVINKKVRVVLHIPEIV